MVKKILLWVAGCFLILAVGAACFLLIPVSAQATTVNPVPNAKVDVNVLQSEVLGVDRGYSIFLPKSYATDTTRHYPILYMLHGLSDTNEGWFENMHFKDIYDMLIDTDEIDEMIVVMPNAGGDILTEWNGYFDLKEWKYETFFFTEFLPFIEKEYRVVGDKQHRAIAGISMGGGGATAYAQRHSELFSAVYAMSALMNTPKNMGSQGPTNNVDKEQGSSTEKAPAGKKVSRLEMMQQYSKMIKMMSSVKENSCITYVEKSNDARKEQLRSVKWFVDCGDDDYLLDRNIEFVQAMREAQIPCQFRVGNGGHTWEYWHLSLFNCLKFVSRNFGK